MPIYTNNQYFEKISFTKEADFEKEIVGLADQIFGNRSIYIDIMKKIEGNNIGIIPE